MSQIGRREQPVARVRWRLRFGDRLAGSQRCFRPSALVSRSSSFLHGVTAAPWPRGSENRFWHRGPTVRRRESRGSGKANSRLFLRTFGRCRIDLVVSRAGPRFGESPVASLRSFVRLSLYRIRNKTRSGILERWPSDCLSVRQ